MCCSTVCCIHHPVLLHVSGGAGLGLLQLIYLIFTLHNRGGGGGPYNNVIIYGHAYLVNLFCLQFLK